MTDDAKRRDIALVVDDSPETLSVLTDALEEAGITVLVALDGSSALALLDHITPDLVLMDATMPGMDGFDPQGFVLPGDASSWLQGFDHRGGQRDASPGRTLAFDLDTGQRRLEISYLSRIGPDEFLLRLTDADSVGDEAFLKQHLLLTARESEVLLW